MVSARLQGIMMIAGAVLATAVAACASGSGGAHGRTCAPEPRDTVYRSSGVVYRECAVDHAARPTSTNVHPSFTPNVNGGQTCYNAEFEFVVDENGRPESRTIQELHANDRAFARSVADIIPLLKYEPATIGSNRVKQIVTYKQQAAIGKMIVAAGAPIRPPTPRAPSC